MKMYEFIDRAITNTIGLKYKNYYFDEKSSDALVDIVEVVRASSIGEMELKEIDDDNDEYYLDDEDTRQCIKKSLPTNQIYMVDGSG